MSKANRIFSFSLPPETTEILDGYEKGKKSRMVSDAIWWYTQYSVDEISIGEIIENNHALQKIIHDLRQQLGNNNHTLQKIILDLSKQLGNAGGNTSD